MLENLIKNISKDRVESNIFSSIMLNPTLLEKDASLLEVPT